MWKSWNKLKTDMFALLCKRLFKREVFLRLLSSTCCGLLLKASWLFPHFYESAEQHHKTKVNNQTMSNILAWVRSHILKKGEMGSGKKWEVILLPPTSYLTPIVLDFNGATIRFSPESLPATHSCCHHMSYYRDCISLQVSVFGHYKRHQNSSILEDLFSPRYLQGRNYINVMYEFAQWNQWTFLQMWGDTNTVTLSEYHKSETFFSLAKCFQGNGNAVILWVGTWMLAKAGLGYTSNQTDLRVSEALLPLEICLQNQYQLVMRHRSLQQHWSPHSAS